jgi:hypothetical protein
MENQKKVSEMSDTELKENRVKVWWYWCEYLKEQNQKTPTFEEFDKRMYEIHQERETFMDRRVRKELIIELQEKQEELEDLEEYLDTLDSIEEEEATKDKIYDIEQDIIAVLEDTINLLKRNQ